MPLSDHETKLIAGHRLKKIGNRYAILDECGVQVGTSTRTEALAVKRLLEHRIAHTQRGSYIGGRQRDTFLKQEEVRSA